MYVGIDNGVTGSIGVIEDGAYLYGMPTRKEQSYTKKKQQITRVDHMALGELLDEIASMATSPIRAFIERPYVNPTGMKATLSAMRCLESVLIAVESRGWSYQYVDSRAWQKELLPSGTKGTADLKAASRDIGRRIFPELDLAIARQKDADAILIAEWARRNNL